LRGPARRTLGGGGAQFHTGGKWSGKQKKLLGTKKAGGEKKRVPHHNGSAEKIRLKKGNKERRRERNPAMGKRRGSSGELLAGEITYGVAG